MRSLGEAEQRVQVCASGYNSGMLSRHSSRLPVAATGATGCGLCWAWNCGSERLLINAYSKRHNYADGTRETTEVRPLVEGIVLDPDVQAYFPDAEAVNTALRGLNFDTQGRFLGTLGD